MKPYYSDKWEEFKYGLKMPLSILVGIFIGLTVLVGALRYKK